LREETKIFVPFYRLMYHFQETLYARTICETYIHVLLTIFSLWLVEDLWSILKMFWKIPVILSYILNASSVKRLYYSLNKTWESNTANTEYCVTLVLQAIKYLRFWYALSSLNVNLERIILIDHRAPWNYKRTIPRTRTCPKISTKYHAFYPCI